MASLRLLWRILRALWRSGLLRMSLREALGALSAWRRCRSSYAALAAIASLRFPRACALHDEQGTLSFAELVAGSEALAASLSRECGLESKAAVLCRNHRGFVLAVLALSRLGLDILLLGPDSPAPALGHILQAQAPELVLHDEEFAPLLEACAPQARRRRVGVPAAALLERRLPRARRASRIVVLTSGSTGVPKGVRRKPTLSSLLPPLAGLFDGMPLQMHRPAVLAIPLYHGYGLTTLAMSLALAAPLHLARRFDIGPLLARLPPEVEPVVVSVPTLLQRWIREGPPGRQPAAVVTGSAPLEPALCVKLLDALGPVLFNLYGSTEAGLIAMAVPDALRAAPGAVGRPLPGTKVRLLDGSGLEVAQGALGRIQVAGPLVLNAGQEGWLDTGDLGRVDRDGRLFVCGRADAMFVSGGENVYPEETEAALAAHPGVAEAAVAVVPDAELGQRMEAYVVARPGQPLDEEGLRAWLRERLERHKLPRRIHLVESIPRNALGKVDRAGLAAMQAKLSA